MCYEKSGLKNTAFSLQFFHIFGYSCVIKTCLLFLEIGLSMFCQLQSNHEKNYFMTFGKIGLGIFGKLCSQTVLCLENWIEH